MARRPGRVERSEVFTSGFVPELDSQIDAWPDATTGFHAIEAKLFGAGVPPMSPVTPMRWSCTSTISTTGCAASR